MCRLTVSCKYVKSIIFAEMIKLLRQTRTILSAEQRNDVELKLVAFISLFMESI